MDLHSKIGQLLFIGIEGTEPNDDLRQFLEEIRPGGIILFSRNIVDPHQLRRFCSFLSRSVDPPPLLSIDQEGGRVNRLSGLLGPLPSMARLVARSGPGSAEVEAIEAFARSTARALRALGFNMDFAPVVDLSSPGAENGIGDRAFGDDPATVARLSGVFADTLQNEGIAAVLKHFPGLGDTDADTHVSMPTCAKPFERLWDEDLLPYRLNAERSSAIMVGHAHYSALDPDRAVPASLSPAVMDDLLRKKLGYSGVAITDDLEMGAVSREMTPDGLAAFSLKIGSDMMMICKSPARIETSQRGLVRAIQAARLPIERVDEAFERVLAAKERLGLRPVSPELPERAFEAARLALKEITERVGV